MQSAIVVCNLRGQSYCNINSPELMALVSSISPIDFTFVTDERICDGFYFASGLKLFRSYLANPSVLDTPPQEVIRDVE